MEDSPLDLDKWLTAMWLVASNRNGVSSWEMHRALGITQKSAWFLLHRIRLAMQDDLTGGNLGGQVEIDKTFRGGRARNMHKDRKLRVMQGKRGGADSGGKSIVTIDRRWSATSAVARFNQHECCLAARRRARLPVEPGNRSSA